MLDSSFPWTIKTVGETPQQRQTQEESFSYKGQSNKFSFWWTGSTGWGWRGGLQPNSLFFFPQPPPSPDELYSPFLSRSYSPTGSSISISRLCCCVSSTSSALISLITSCRAEPQTIYLSTAKPSRPSSLVESERICSFISQRSIK